MYLRHLLPEALNDLFCRNEQIHHYNTRNKIDLHPVKIKTKLYGEKTISFQRRNRWNKLPSDIKEINSVFLFKKKLKQHINNLLKQNQIKLLFFSFYYKIKAYLICFPSTLYLHYLVI